MQKSLKKISRKSLSLLIALIMVISAIPFSPLSSPIEANAAETKTTISVWDASRATTNTASGARYSYKDSQTKKTISGIQWHGLTKNSTYLTVNDTALSIAEINNSGAITKNDNIADLGISGNKWSFSAKFAYTGSATKTTVFGLASTTKRQYTQSNTGGDTVISNGYVADLVDIRANGDVYLNDTWTSKVSGISSNDLYSSSATSPKTLTVTYDNGNLTIDIDGTQKISQRVDTTLFSAGVGNYIAGPNVQVFSGANSGIYPHYQVTNNGAYLWNFNLYSLSGATYQTTGGGSEPTAPTNKTISVIGYGILKNSGKDNRANNNVLGIVNDQYDANFDIGFVNFDISSLSNSEFNVASAIYNMTYSMASSGREAMGLSFYYATKNNDAFNRTDKPANFTNTTYDSNIFGTDNQHIANATSYLGLVNIGSVNTATNTTNASIPIDLAPAIKYALKKGETRFQLLIMLKEAGGAGGAPWTDTNVTVPTTPVSVTMQTHEDYVKANINVEGKVNKNYSNIVENNAGAYTGNIIVADQWTASQNNTYYLEKNQIASDNLRFYAYNNAVALYTGAGNIRFPIVLEKVAVSNPSGYDVYQNIEYTALNNGGLFSLGNDNNQWQYCTSSTNLTDAVSGEGEGQVVTNFSNSTSASKDSYKANGSNINYAKNDKFGTTTTKAFKNYIKYTGSGNSDTYYDKLSTPTFSYRADYAVFWKDGWYWDLTNVHDKAFTLNSDFTCYVLNYKPLYDIVSNASFKDNYNRISQNSSKYSQEGLNNYYAVVADIIDFNLANEPMTSETEVAAVANKIKDLVERYNRYKSPKLNKYNVTFKTSDPDNIMAAPVVVKTVEVEPGTTVAASNFPKLKATHYDKDNKHYVYYWYNTSSKTEFTSATKVDSNIEVEERRKLVACTYDPNDATCMSQAVCDVCKTKVGDLKPHSYTNAVFVAADGDNNSYTKYLCVNGCGQEDESLRKYESTDWSAYDAQKRVLDDLLADRTKFSAASLAECQTAYDNAVGGVTSGDETKSQTFINNRTADLIAAKNLLKSTVTFKVYDDSVGGSPSLLTTESFDVKYLDTKDIIMPKEYETDYTVISWKRNINGVESQIATNTSSISAIISSNITYMLYLKKTSVDDTQIDANKAVVTLNNKSNKVYDIGYVEKSSGVQVTVDVDNGSITVGGQTLKAPTYSFYRVTGFKINGKTVNTGTIDITGDIIIKPEYEARTSFIITGGSGVVEKSTTTSWDKRVRLTAETPAQSGKINEWTSTINGQNVVWGYGDTLSFQATQACTVECTEVDATEFDGSEDVKLSVDYVSYNLYRANSITAISRVVAPEGTVVEYGTILKTANIKAGASNANYETQKAAVNNKDNYKVTNKSGVFKSTQMISNTNQFAYNFYSAQDYDKMYVGAVAYAKLSNGTTVYSDVVTYEVK